MASHTRRAGKGSDPLLKTHAWQLIKAHWRRVRDPCHRCGTPIDYDSPRYYEGTRRVNPHTLAVGHIVGRHEARLLGWTDAMINQLSNTQPEHARCSDTSGATYGNGIRSEAQPPMFAIDDW